MVAAAVAPGVISSLQEQPTRHGREAKDVDGGEDSGVGEEETGMGEVPPFTQIRTGKGCRQQY